MAFSWSIFLSLLAACGALMVLERRGLPTTLSLTFKGDIKRESRWLAQYGQAVCTVVAALLVVQLDPAGWNRAVPVLVATFGATLVTTAIKKSVSRVRPGRENAGKFLGPSLKHGNFKESFPSSHSACAVALSAALAAFYPAAAGTFWVLAIGCAVLRYLLDAHWPSDVLGGIAVGYGVAHLALFVLGAR
ncbi:MAG: phosphoesterase [Phycisphaerales bacterium]|nr:phosphoesterase [Phycisphaerales bacterium]